MWTKQSEILAYCEQYLGVSVDEILQSLPKYQITVNEIDVLKEIEKFAVVKNEKNNIFNENNENDYVFNEEAYNYNVKALAIYKKKTLTMSRILIALSRNFDSVDKIVSGLDLTIEDDKISTKDLNRILKPLKTNFELVQKVCENANSAERYIASKNSLTNRKKVRLPLTGILNCSMLKSSNESIEMTEKQRRARAEMKIKLTKQIYDKMIDENEKDC